MADGSLKFDTKIDTEGFEKGTNTLKGMMDRVVSSIKRAGSGVASAFSDSGSIDGTNAKIKALVDEIDQYRDSLYYLEKQGLYFGDTEYDDTYQKLSLAERALNDYKKSLSGVDGQQKKATSSAKRFGSSLKQTTKASIPLTKSIIKLSSMFKLLVVRMGMRAVIRSVQEGFQNLAQYSKQSNKDISALMTSLQTLKNSFATAFAPILTVVVPILKTLIGYLSEAISTIGQFFAAFLTGATTFTKAKDAQVDYAKSLKKTGKEANKTLSPIDKLNNVGDDSGGGGGYEAPSPAQMFEDVEINSKILDFVDKLKKLLEPTIAAFERLKKAIDPFAKNVGQGLKWFYDNVLVPLATWAVADLIPAFLDVLGAAITVLNSIIEAFKPYGSWLWENFLKPIATWTGDMIINGLQLLTDGLYALSDWIMNNQETFVVGALLIGGFFAAFKIAKFLAMATPFLVTMGEFIASGGLLSAVLGGISTAFSALISPVAIIATTLGLLVYSFIDLYNSCDGFREAISNLGKTWQEALKPLAEFVGTVLTDAWNEILKPVIDFFINTLLPNLINTFKNLWANILVPLANFIGTVLSPIFKILSDLLTMLWKKVVLPLAKAVGGVLKEAWNALYDILNQTVIPIISNVIKALQFLWEKVINPIIKVLWDNLKPAFDVVFDGISTVINGLKTTLSGIINFIAGVFTGDWKRAWNGIKDIFKGIFDSLVGIVKTPINLIIEIINGMIGGIVSGVNAVIRAINSISFTIPDWVPGIGGKGIGFNIKEFNAPKIPKLATGTVVPANYGEFLSILGDNRREPEVVSPVSTLKQAVREVAEEIGGLGGGEIHIYLEGDARGVFKLVRVAEGEHYEQTGRAVFVH